MASSETIKVGSLQINPEFFRFITDELLPTVGIQADVFWSGLESIIHDLTPINRELLAQRDSLQEKIDDWHKARAGEPLNHDEYVAFLREVGYLRETGEPFQITTENVDTEIAEIAGPQLVVPVSNARFALNAANARWGSLYDALYGTDVISEENGCERGGAYNPQRGAAVIQYAAEFLDRAIPLPAGSHADGNSDAYVDAPDYVGSRESGSRRSYLFCNNNLHIEIQTDPEHVIGRDAAGNISDVVLESAVTTIQDCEDSVAAVDAEDKVGVYRNWLGLMTGELSASFAKGKSTLERRLNDDRKYETAGGEELTLSGRSLLLVRNVGHLMQTDAVFDRDGNVLASPNYRDTELANVPLDKAAAKASLLSNRLLIFFSEKLLIFGKTKIEKA